jgi:hypothetical protein
LAVIALRGILDMKAIKLNRNEKLGETSINKGKYSEALSIFPSLQKKAGMKVKRGKCLALLPIALCLVFLTLVSSDLVTSPTHTFEALATSQYQLYAINTVIEHINKISEFSVICVLKAESQTLVIKPKKQDNKPKHKPSVERISENQPNLCHLCVKDFVHITTRPQIYGIPTTKRRAFVCTYNKFV